MRRLRALYAAVVQSVNATAKRIAHQRSAFDAEVIEQCQHRIGAVAVVLLVLGVLVGVAVAGLVDGDDMEVPGQHGDVAAEVRPARGARAAAVQQHHGLAIALAGLVIVQAHIPATGAHLGISRGGIEGDFLLCDFNLSCVMALSHILKLWALSGISGCILFIWAT